MRRVLPSITSIGITGSSWRDKIREVESLEVEAVALFVTCLSIEERAACYRALRQVQSHRPLQIPFVHAVSDMSEDEFRLLEDTFGTERFNLHPVRDYPLRHSLSDRIREKIFIENASSDSILHGSDVEGFAGLCIDLSHAEDFSRNDPEGFSRFVEFALHYEVGANHISGVRTTPYISQGRRIYSNHVAQSIADFDYLAHLPGHLFSSLCAIEIENSIAEQLTLVDPISRVASEAEMRSLPLPRKAA